MAEENKNPEVELDTDGVKEETIQVEQPEEQTTPFEQKEEVDLGYTDVSGEKKTAKELLQEVKESEKKEEPKPTFEQKEEEPSDLEDYSEKVQKRIKKLTFQVKEAERRERAAMDYAKGLKTKYETAQTKVEETDTNYLKEYNGRIDAEREKAKNKRISQANTEQSQLIQQRKNNLPPISFESNEDTLDGFDLAEFEPR
jgi:hypothetical protein